MVASVEVRSFHTGTSGSPGSDNVVTQLRFKRNVDNDVVETLNPLLVPPSGQTYSMRKQIKLKFTSLPDNEISNLRLLVTGLPTTLGTGRKLYAKVVATYDPAVTGPAGDEAALVAVGMEDITSGSSFGGDGIMDINTGTVLTSGGSVGFGTQDFSLLQVEIDAAASTGPGNTINLSFRYDES